MGGTPVRILLTRHGETVFNVEGRWQGQSDSPLTERGLAQARELGRALSAEPIAAVYTSDLGRAAATAAEVAGPHGLQVVPDERLREIHVGAWTGLGRAEIEARYPGGLHAWAHAPSKYELPGGERIGEAQQRALEFFADRMPRHVGETIVVVSHGAISQAIVVHAMGRTVDDLWLKERMDNCQISRLEWTPERGLELIELSDVRHLEQVGSLQGWRASDAERASVAAAGSADSAGGAATAPGSSRLERASALAGSAEAGRAAAVAEDKAPGLAADGSEPESPTA